MSSEGPVWNAEATRGACAPPSIVRHASDQPPVAPRPAVERPSRRLGGLEKRRQRRRLEPPLVASPGASNDLWRRLDQASEIIFDRSIETTRSPIIFLERHCEMSITNVEPNTRPENGIPDQRRPWKRDTFINDHQECRVCRVFFLCIIVGVYRTALISPGLDQ